MYGNVTHHLMAARQALADSEPSSDRERDLLESARLSVDSALLAVRRIHHGARWWQ